MAATGPSPQQLRTTVNGAYYYNLNRNGGCLGEPLKRIRECVCTQSDDGSWTFVLRTKDGIATWHGLPDVATATEDPELERVCNWLVRIMESARFLRECTDVTGMKRHCEFPPHWDSKQRAGYLDDIEKLMSVFQGGSSRISLHGQKGGPQVEAFSFGTFLYHLFTWCPMIDGMKNDDPTAWETELSDADPALMDFEQPVRKRRKGCNSEPVSWYEFVNIPEDGPLSYANLHAYFIINLLKPCLHECLHSCSSTDLTQYKLRSKKVGNAVRMIRLRFSSK
jgi:hypothetical protein